MSQDKADIIFNAAMESFKSLDSLIEAKVNRAVKQAVAMHLYEKAVPNHGADWTDAAKENFETEVYAFVRNQAFKYGRTQTSALFRTLRSLKKLFPTEYRVVGKE